MEQHFLKFFKKEDNLACSQTLYFLFKVRRASVLKYKPQGIYWLPAQGGKERKNETTSVYRLRTTSQLGIPKFWKFFSRNFSFHSILPWYFYNFRLNGWYFGNSQFPEFLETFPGNFCTVCMLARVVKWWECLPPTSVAWVQIPASMPYVGWVCCWFSPLLREVFLRVLRFSPLLKRQHLQIPIRPGIR